MPLASLLDYFIPAVGNLMVVAQDATSITLHWKSPSISNKSSDAITYCVNVTTATAITIATECTLSATEFEYSLPEVNWCDRYLFTVTPMTPLFNGTKKTVPYDLDNLTRKLHHNRDTVLHIIIVFFSPRSCERDNITHQRCAKVNLTYGRFVISYLHREGLGTRLP